METFRGFRVSQVHTRVYNVDNGRGFVSSETRKRGKREIFPRKRTRSVTHFLRLCSEPSRAEWISGEPRSVHLAASMSESKRYTHECTRAQGYNNNKRCI